MFVDTVFFIGPFLLFTHINSYQSRARTEKNNNHNAVSFLEQIKQHFSMYNVFIDCVTKLTVPSFRNLIDKKSQTFFLNRKHTDIKTISLFHSYKKDPENVTSSLCVLNFMVSMRTELCCSGWLDSQPFLLYLIFPINIDNYMNIYLRFYRIYILSIPVS